MRRGCLLLALCRVTVWPLAAPACLPSSSTPALPCSIRTASADAPIRGRARPSGVADGTCRQPPGSRIDDRRLPFGIPSVCACSCLQRGARKLPAATADVAARSSDSRLRSEAFVSQTEVRRVERWQQVEDSEHVAMDSRG